MSRLDEIQARVDARMAEIFARVSGEAAPAAAAPAERRSPYSRGGADVRFDISGVVSSLRSEVGSVRGGVCRRVGLCVGLEQVDPAAYGGVPQPCPGCDLDATDFANILSAAGFATTCLVNKDATRSRVIGEMRRAAATLSAGDLLVMSVAGHGARGSLDGGGGTETHESWCLWDGQLIDDDIVAAVGEFRPGVRIVMVNDQCHCGGIFEGYSKSSRGMAMPFFRSAAERVPSPMLIQFAACRAEEQSVGYPIGGTWTTALMKVLAVDRHISWRDWFAKASSHPSLTPRQTPQWFEFGPVSSDFRNGEVFV